MEEKREIMSDQVDQDTWAIKLVPKKETPELPSRQQFMGRNISSLKQ